MKANKIITHGLFLLFCALFAFACDEKDKNGRTPDTAVSGDIKISVDESLKPIGDAEVKTFMQTYRKAKIDASYKSETDALKDMFMDTARVIIIPRQLTEPEMKFYTDKKHPVKSVLIAYDAIALIVNKSNPDSTFTMAQLTGMMNGSINNWKQLKGKDSKIQIVFDNVGSSTLEYVKNKFHIDRLPVNFSAAKSNEEVINYVTSTPNALGFIGLSWIGNEDSLPNSFLKKIKVVALPAPDTAKGTDRAFYPPFQAWIKLGYYPLLREVYAISPEYYNGLGSGFITFMAGETGQIKVFQSGLLPATQHTRLIQIKKEY
jgi:phosphate transport system substrate-binding protein